MPTDYVRDSPYRPRSRQTSPPARPVSARYQQAASLRFLSEFVREPFKVGALWPSSRRLARVMANSCDIRPGMTLVELGPGTGSFTEYLLKRLNNRGHLMAVEISPTHAEILRKRFARCDVVLGSAENLPAHLGGRKVECVVSGLAWSNMLPRVQDRMLEAVMSSLTEGGQFVAFAYTHAFFMPTAVRFRRQLKLHFRRVETTATVWRNVPPAYVLKCWR
jgi:phosphatidylethanolamine/phosphatidyl-N-methylethanolamine N-methyltransferase